jgi:predicted nucleic acid-binding protein
MNRGCAEHVAAKAWLDAALEEPRAWIFADQVLFELYRLLRHPKVMAKPLSAKAAVAQIVWLREETGFLHCGYEESRWSGVLEALKKHRDRSGLLVHDAVLAETLRAQGVERFYTRNKADFSGFGFFEVVNPLA